MAPESPSKSLLDENFAKNFPFTILVAEDNSINQKLIIRILNKLGYSPQLAKTGREVLHLIGNEAIDVILMDVQMPEMGGLEATEIIRKNLLLKQPVIIAMTANAMSEDKQLCLQVGMDAYLSKPLDIKALIKTLRTIKSANNAT